MDEKGFSLIEAVLTAMVISLLASVALPRLFFQYSTLTLDRETERLAAALAVYREESVYAAAQRQEFLDASEHQVPVFRLERGGYSIKGRTGSKRHTLPAGIELSCNRVTVMFYGTGNAEPLTIILRSGTERRYVIIDLAGRIRVSLTPP
ncbi:MAG: hypothetical protein IJS96_02920 [Schwartzia sp.]|nr:hypothetical protein [Schwartzia sp. (in: firmicutes)]